MYNNNKVLILTFLKPSIKKCLIEKHISHASLAETDMCTSQGDY